MKTIPLPPHAALALAKFQNQKPGKLGDYFWEAWHARNRKIEAGEYPLEITITRGQRINATIIPKNMLENMKEDEARAWNHSDLAGVLWESGMRATRAIKIASTTPPFNIPAFIECRDSAGCLVYDQDGNGYLGGKTAAAKYPCKDSPMR